MSIFSTGNKQTNSIARLTILAPGKSNKFPGIHHISTQTAQGKNW